jgi:hypothetical protein
MAACDELEMLMKSVCLSICRSVFEALTHAPRRPVVRVINGGSITQ